MAAARQKEMNVSITEDATMSRTRSDGGATVVRVDAINYCASKVVLPLRVKKGYYSVRPWLSLVLDEAAVNR
jgi:hypothetical protein